MSARTAFLLLASITTMSWCSVTAIAQEADEREIVIAEQALPDSLKLVADEFGLQLAFFSEVAEDFEAPALNGSYTQDQALEALLAETMLEYGYIDNGTVVVRTKDRRGASDSKNLTPTPVLLAQNQLSQAQTTASSRSDEGGTGIVTGKVTDARTGAKLKGAKVTIEETGQWTSSNDLGEFRFVNVPTGSATLTVSFLGYAGQSAVVGVRGDRVVQDFALRGGSEMEEIVVFGQRSARALALNQERTSENSINVLSADLLGEIPGTTISETLRRVPGVSFQRSSVSGDGTNIVIRGLEPDLNLVKINGLEVPNSSGLDRAANLGNLLTESIERVTVSKTLLANQDSAGSGGLVEIETKSPLDRPRRFASASLEFGDRSRDFNEELIASTTLSGLFGTNDQFGISASVQYWERESKRIAYNSGLQFGQWLPLQVDGTPTITSVGGIDPTLTFPFEPQADKVYPESLETDQDSVDTENLSVNLSLAWQPAEHTQLRLDYQTAEATETQISRASKVRSIMRTVEDGVVALDGAVRRIYDFEAISEFFVVQSVRLTDDAEDDLETVSFRGDSSFGPLSFRYLAGYAKGSSTQPNYSSTIAFFRSILDPSAIDFISEAAVDPVEGRIISIFPERSGRRPPTPLLSELGLARLNDPENYGFTRAAGQTAIGSRENWTGEISGRIQLDWHALKYVEAGIQFEESDFNRENAAGVGQFSYFGQRDENGDLPGYDLLGIEFSEDNLADIGASSPFRVISINDIRPLFLDVLPSVAVPPEIAGPGDISVFNRTFENDPAEGTEESELSAFLQGRIDIANLEIIGGLRFSQIEVNSTRRSSPRLIRADGSEDEEFARVNDRLVTESATQTTVLPRVLVNYRPNDDLILRGGYFQSIARPQIQLLTDKFSVFLDLQPNPSFGGLPVLDVRKGNPDLKSARTHSYDLSAEYYNDTLGVIRGAVFYKRIDNLLESNSTSGDGALQQALEILPDDSRFQDVVDNPQNYFVSITLPINNDSPGEIWGVELAMERQFTSLPGLFSGLGFYANYTYTESSKDQPTTWRNAPVRNSNGDLVFDENGNLQTEDQVILLKDVQFAAQPEHSGSVGVTYNQYGLDASLSYTRQSRVLTSFSRPDLSFFDEPFDSLDFRGEYRFGGQDNERYRLFVEGLDLLRGTSDPSIESTWGGYFVGGVYFGGRQIRAGFRAVF